ncbi:hypothetical protein [Saccharomonospora viridis]|jgi:hypothetical protein|nr:hypothetical protein [Saccharomonospora viridis]
MTYPPAPGQPGQPDPYGGQQPGQWGHPPQQPQQQPGFPSSGPMPHQFGGPQQGYPGPQSYPGGPQYGQPGFGGPDAPPPKKKTGLIVGICIAAAVVIGGAVTLILLLTGDDEDSDTVAAPPTTQSAPQSPNETPDGLPPNPGIPSPDEPGQVPSDLPDPGGSSGDKAAVEALANDAVTALNNFDNELARKISCNPANTGFDDDVPEGVTFRLDGEVIINGDTAQIPIKIEYMGQSQTENFPAAKKDNGEWCMGILD